MGGKKGTGFFPSYQLCRFALFLKGRKSTTDVAEACYQQFREAWGGGWQVTAAVNIEL